MPRNRATKLRQAADLENLTRQNPKGRTNARIMGVELGKFVRYKDADGREHFGTVFKVHQKTVEIEQTAERLFAGGENRVIREEEVPFGLVLEVLGDHPIAVRAPATPSKPPEAPPKRKEGYLTCDVRRCEKKPVAVLWYVKKGLVALCREHYGLPGEVVPWRFKLDVICHEWKVPSSELLSEPSE